MTDPSTYAQRTAFSNAVEGGSMVATRSCATAVAASTTQMPATTSTLLGLPDDATYATGAARVMLGVV